jgi:hypothetical protein
VENNFHGGGSFEIVGTGLYPVFTGSTEGIAAIIAIFQLNYFLGLWHEQVSG